MNANYFYFLLLFTSISLTTIAQETGFPIIHNYTPKEYNNSPQVFSTVQDDRGILYFGGNGVIEYDGVSWQTIPIEKNAFVVDLAVDTDGKIYVGAVDEFGYLSTDKKGNYKYHSLTPLINDTTLVLGPVWSISLTSQFVYFQTYDAILQYSPLAEKITIFRAESKNKFFGDFVYKDIYYVKSQKKGLIKIENNELKTVVQSRFIKVFTSAVPYDTSTLLIPTQIKGLYLYKPDTDSVPIDFTIQEKDFIKDNVIHSATTHNENIVLGSAIKGALLIDKRGKTLQQYHESNLLQDNSVERITSDKNQNFWFGLDNGISKTEHSQDLSYWDKNSGLKGLVANLIRYNDIIYIATTIGVYFIDKKNQIQQVQGIPPGQNWHFLKTENFNSLLIGTGFGIYEINENKATQIYKSSHVIFLHQSIKDPNRVIFIDDSFVNSLKYENGQWIPEGLWDGINDQIRWVIEDDSGEIWLGTRSKGVVRVTPNYENITKPKKLRYYNEKDGLNSLQDIFLFKYENKATCSTTNGLYIYNEQTDHFEPYCKLGEKFCNQNTRVSFIKEGADGTIWICPDKNDKADIGYLQPTTKGGYDWVYAPFRRIPDMAIYTFYIEDSDIAWIGGNNGLYRYDMRKDTKNYTQKFNCLLRKITIGVDSLIYGGNKSNLKDFENEVELEYKLNSIKFEFAAPFFDEEEKTLYSYQLEGFDKAWSKWSRKTKKEYTNLPAGTYTIKVKALNVYDVESEIDTYQITVLPPFYKTWWAYSIYLIILILVIWITIKLNTHRLRKEKEQLEGIIKQRTSEVVQQKDEILAQNEAMLIQRNEIEAQATKLQIQNTKLQELNEFKQGLTSMIVHDLKNPLNLIINTPKSANYEKQIDSMQQTGKQMLNMVLNILDVDKYEDINMTLDIEDKQFVLTAKNAIKRIQFLSEQKNILIKNQIDHHIVTKVEEGIAERILVNLLTNAIKYTPLNGTITLSSSPKSETFVQIEVTDTGEGIPKEKLHLVFQKFGQIVAKKSGGVRSTGLGLTFCKLAVEAHGGEIGLSSEVGKGTTFWFTLKTGTSNYAVTETVEKEIEVKDERIQFTEMEKEILRPFINRLNEFSIYETGDIEGIVAELKYNKEENIQKWLEQLNDSLVYLNQSKYQKLLKVM